MDKLYFDAETTGADPSKDRIVQLAIRVVDDTDTVIVSKSKLYNPGIPISPSATEVHGITDEQVKNEPSFKSDAKKLKKLFENKIIVTFNGMRFDVPLLMSEFERAGVDVELSGKFIDVMKVERKLQPNSLGATYKRYTGNVLEGAHDAMADVVATETVLLHQKLRAHGEGVADAEEDLFEDLTGMADWFGKLKYDSEGFLVFNFGKHINKRIISEPDYASWILGENFPSQVKKLITKEQSKGLKTAPPAASKVAKNGINKFGAPKAEPINGYQPLFTAGSEDTYIDDLPF